MSTIRVFEAFAGYGSQALALERLQRDYPNFKFESVGISEIDKFAVQSYNALHPNVKNYGDISKIDWSEVPDFDLFTYSFPCQDISNAGMQRGLTEDSGTRSSLLWECRRAIEIKKPKYLLMENVAALVSEKFLPMFNKWCVELESYGYYNFSQVLNAKDYGVPQNRERIFVVSIREDVRYFFPLPMKLNRRLKDVLEDDVDEKYYLSAKLIEGFSKHNEHHIDKGTGFLWKPKNGDDIANTLRANAALAPTDNTVRIENDDYKIKQKKIIKEDDNINKYKYNNKRLQNLIDSGKVDNNKIQLLDAYNQNVHEDVSITIKARINADSNTFISEPKVQQVGNLLEDKNFKNPQVERIYGTDGLCPALNTVAGGNLEPKIIEPTIVDDTYKNRDARLYNEVSPTLRSEREGFKVIEPKSMRIYEQAKEVLDNNECEEGDTILPYNKEVNKSGICPTLTTRPEGLKTAIFPVVKSDNVLEPNNIEDTEDYIESLPRKEFDGPDAYAKAHEYLNGLRNEESHEQQEYRIRKLTPRECYRLMGVDDADIDKIQAAGISNAQQYKQAGNSIVVDVLYHIFRKMFVETENESQEQTLF